MNTQAHTNMFLEAAAVLSRRVIQVRDGYSSGNDEARAGLWKRMHEANMEYLNAVHHQPEPHQLMPLDVPFTVTRPDPSRAEMAMAAVQGLLSNTDFATHAQKFPGRTYQDVVAEAAVNCAEALQAALARKEKQ